MDDANTPEGPETPQCSAKSCREAARWSLIWRNPRIHGTARTKTWLACDAHREHLSSFLDRRDFLLEVTPFTRET